MKIKPLQDHLVKYGGWPIVEGDKWKGDNIDIYEIMASQVIHYSLNIHHTYSTLSLAHMRF